MTDDLDTAPLWFGEYERRLNKRLDKIEGELAELRADSRLHHDNLRHFVSVLMNQADLWNRLEDRVHKLENK